MELELLNDQLRKGQPRAEMETRSHEAASLAMKVELVKAEHRLNAMPKRFTESLQVLRDEVEGLEKERVALQLATQRMSLEVKTHTMPIPSRFHAYRRSRFDIITIHCRLTRTMRARLFQHLCSRASTRRSLSAFQHPGPVCLVHYTPDCHPVM